MPRARATAADIGLPASQPIPTEEAVQRLRKDSAFRSALEADLIRGRYALIVTGDCMAPALPAGGKILVDAEATPRVGDFVAIYFQEEAVRRYGHAAAVKRLVIDLRKGNVAGPDGRRGVIASMLNPPKALFFPAEDILAIHRVVGPLPADVQTIVVDKTYFDALAHAASGQQ